MEAPDKDWNLLTWCHEDLCPRCTGPALRATAASVVFAWEASSIGRRVYSGICYWVEKDRG